ncbi:MAG: cupin domain-containing protein [Desulfovibrio sp.]|nr:cupin domain-containing protein [Desulfovibrio sp.]
MAKQDTNDTQNENEIIAALRADGGAVYPVGVPNSSLAQYFTGRSYVAPLQKTIVNVTNVTFEPGCINHWHKHHGSCQVLAGVSGKGYYQIWGEAPKELLPGQSVTIPENVKHWHGAQHGHWFQHLSIMKEGASTEWLEPVSPSEYAKLQ